MLTYPAAAAPIVLGLAAAVVWGGADFTGGIAARRGHSGSLVFLAHGTSLVLLLPAVLWTHTSPLSGQSWVWGLLSGAFGGFALMLFYEALADGAMGISAALAGVLTAALPVGVAVFREGRPAGLQMAGFAVAALAIGLIAWSPEKPLDDRGTSGRSLVLAAVGGLGFGVQLVVLHLLSAQGSVVRALTLSRAGGAIAGATVMLFMALRGGGMLTAATEGVLKNATGAQPMPTIRSGTIVFLLLAALTGLLDTAGNGLYMSAALVGRMDVAAVLASLYPGATILLAVWLLHERTTRLQAAGMALALVAVALISA